MSRSTALTAAALLLTCGSASAENVGVPSNAATGSSAVVRLTGSSCPSAGNCVAVGMYRDTTGAFQGLIENESSGNWTPLEAPTAGLGAIDAGLEAAACPAAGSCVAVGGYDTSPSDSEGLIETYNNGTWVASKLPLTGLSTASNPHVDLFSLTCSAVGSCVAVGAYADAGGHEEGLIATDAAGTWTVRRADVSAIGGATIPSVQLNSVSCAAPGDCAAVGYYEDSSSHFQGLIETDSGGTWTAARANLAALPSVATNPNVQLTGVSCPAIGDCTAVGRYTDASSIDGSNQGLLISSTNHVWSAAAKAVLPPDASFTAPTVAQQNLRLNAVSCSSPGNCMAVGSYQATSANDTEALQLSESSGTWSAGVQPATPSAAAANPGAQLNSVVCAQTGCTSLGSYLDSTGSTDVWVLGGSGTTASASVPLMTGAESDGMAVLGCSPDGYCAAAGYGFGSSGSHPFLLDSPDAVAGVVLPAPGTQTVTWSAPGDNGGLPLSGYSVTANDQTNPARGGQTQTVTGTSATFTNLTFGDSYTFTITPQSPLGAGVPLTTQTFLAIATAAQVNATLTPLAHPSGTGSSTRAIYRAGGFTFQYGAIEPGTLTVRWYHRARVMSGHGKHHRRRRHRWRYVKRLVASGTLTVSAAGESPIKVALTPYGRRLFKAGRRVRLTESISFVNTQAPALAGALTGSFSV